MRRWLWAQPMKRKNEGKMYLYIMAFVRKTKNKQQEKAVKAFPDENGLIIQKLKKMPSPILTVRKKLHGKKEKVIPKTSPGVG